VLLRKTENPPDLAKPLRREVVHNPSFAETAIDVKQKL
jgi:hypothetical protein